MSEDLGGITCYNHIGGDIFGDDRPGADDGVVANRNTGKDVDTGAYPHIVSYGDGFRENQPGFPLLRVQRVSRRVEVTPRSDEDIVPELDGRAIQDGKAVIGKASLPEVDVIPVVTPERGIDDRAFSNIPEQFLKDFPLGGEIHWRKLIVPVTQVFGAPYLIQEIRFGSGVIKFTGISFFLFRLHVPSYKWVVQSVSKSAFILVCPAFYFVLPGNGRAFHANLGFFRHSGAILRKNQVDLLRLIAVILVAAFLPNERLSGRGGVSLSLLKRFHPSVVGMFLVMVLFFIYPTNFALTASGTLSEMGVTLTMVGLDVVAFLVGLCFGFLMKRFAAQMKYIAPLGFAAGYLCLAVGGSLVWLLLGSAFVAEEELQRFLAVHKT